MGLRREEDTTENDNQDNMSDRLSSALDFLRDELRQLRAQDVALLRQMLKIQSTIKSLSRTEERRSHSVADELEEEGREPIDVRPRMNSLDRQASFRGQSLRLHPPLSRHRSEPGRMLAEDQGLDEETDCSECDILPLSPNSSFGDCMDDSSESEPSSSSILQRMRQRFATIEEEVPGSHHSSNVSLATSSPTHRSAEGSPKNSFASPTGVSPYGDAAGLDGVDYVDGFDDSTDEPEERPTFEIGYYSMPQAGRLLQEREWHSLDLNQNELAAKNNDAQLWTSLDAVQRLSLGTAGKRASRLEKYEPAYENILKRSSQLWREIQKEQSEKGSVDERKLTTFKLFI